MPRTMRLGVLLRHVIVLLATSAVLLTSGCGNASVHVPAKPTPTLAYALPRDPAPVTVRAGQVTTLNLGGGADLIIPSGAMTPGATVRATYQGLPEGNWAVNPPAFAPVHLIASPPNAFRGVLKLEFPVAASDVLPHIDPALQFGIATYDLTSKTWVPVDSQYDAAHHKVTALIAHFSWWDDFRWDITDLMANILQGSGQLFGERAAPPTCSGGKPSWVQSLGAVLEDSDLAILSCAQSKGNILDIEIVNNRPYGQILTYGASVKWGWHEPGSSPTDLARNKLMDYFVARNELYLPPLGQASVGIFQTAPGTLSTFHIGPTGITVGADLAFEAITDIAGKSVELAVDKIVDTGGCAELATETVLNGIGSTSAIRDDLTEVYHCLETGFSALVASGALNSVAADELNNMYHLIEDSNIVGTGIQIGDYTWKIADLISDYLVNRFSRLGNGFEVLAALPIPTKTPTSASTPTPTYSSPPTPTFPPIQIVYPYNNLGAPNGSYPMCNGNINSSPSQPGGTVSQTFTVPADADGAAVNEVMVVLDYDPTVTAHLSIHIDGADFGTYSATAAGATYFRWGGLPIIMTTGETVTLSLTFTATSGSTINVYTAGSPGGTFSTMNTCSLGASNVTSTSIGLQAAVIGTI